jgi:alkylation response protein AidB-like acyl-CoA dehydrogenase
VTSTTKTVDAETVAREVRALADEFAQHRLERQRRRELDRADFDRLQAAGFQLTGVPVESGGLWRDAVHSTRPIAEMLRALAHGDSSVALVASMHPAVLFSAGWLARPHATSPHDPAWQAQRQWAFQTARDGAWWGTIVSEPGTGGDSSKSRAIARPNGTGSWDLTAQKHFGSGAGIMSYLITSAVPVGEDAVETFLLDVRNAAWDGSGGMKLTAPWEGCGMIATQSHAFLFENFPATRAAWPAASRNLAGLTGPAGQEGFVRTCWAAITFGIVETAVATARQQLARRRTSMRPFEQVEWTRLEIEAWLIQQAYAGMLRAVEQQQRSGQQTLTGKIAVAELAESVLSRMCRVLGGSSYTHDSPFGYWLEDVRALGFLRPPWAFAYQVQFDGAWSDGEAVTTGK